MKRILSAMLGAALAASVLSLSAAAQQPQQQLSVGIVAYQIVLSRSKAIASIRSQVQTEFKAIQEEISRLEADFSKRDDELAKQRTVLSPEAFEEKRQQFQDQLTQARQSLRQRQRAAEQANLRALTQVEQKVTEIVTRLAQERGNNLILDGSAVLIMDPAMDISQNVLSALNAELPTVQVVIQ